VLLEQANEVKDKVRKYFAKGNKSSNKRYFVKHDGTYDIEEIKNRTASGLWSNMDQRLKKAIKRTDLGMAARKNRPDEDKWDTLFELVEILRTMPKEKRSGNCMEMAALSAYYVIVRGYAEPDCTHFVQITKPGDHAFCLVTPNKLSDCDLTPFSSVTAFTKSASASKWFVIDPWLNVACFANEYLFSAHGQLEKWGWEGKRIAWKHGSQGQGWYPATGEYRNKFEEEAPLSIDALG